MARYIDADAFKRKLIDEKSFFPAIVASALKETPTADVVKVVRCEFCRYVLYSEDSCSYSCKRRGYFSETVKPDDFCSHGKENDDVLDG